MAEKILLILTLIFMTFGMITLLLVMLKETTLIKSRAINFFFRERFITKKHIIDKTESGKNLMVFFLAGLVIVLIFNLLVYTEWDPSPSLLLVILGIIVTGAVFFARLIRKTPLADVLSSILQQNFPISREYGEEGEIAPQFRDPKKLTPKQRFMAWADFFFDASICSSLYLWLWLDSSHRFI